MPILVKNARLIFLNTLQLFFNLYSRSPTWSKSLNVIFPLLIYCFFSNFIYNSIFSKFPFILKSTVAYHGGEVMQKVICNIKMSFKYFLKKTFLTVKHYTNPKTYSLVYDTENLCFITKYVYLFHQMYIEYKTCQQF